MMMMMMMTMMTMMILMMKIIFLTNATHNKLIVSYYRLFLSSDSAHFLRY